MNHEEMAKELFKEGYNCSQSVFAAFCDDMNLELKTALKLSSSFGGGMGRLREVCGAVSGMFMVAGVLYGYDEPKDQGIKTEHYMRIQKLANEFREQNHSIICRELLGVEGASDNPIPEARTEEYYAKRPCIDLVGDAAKIMENYIMEVKQNENISNL
jgi:C_GCAxxG_C_C family probable redox protein